jgi:hypothetical protein
MPDRSISIGVAAHIKGAAPGSARYDETMQPEQRRAINNGIWMCQADGTLVDRDATRYPEELLRAWKSNAEAEARNAMEAPRGKAANAVTIHIHLPAAPPSAPAPKPRIVPMSVRGSQLNRVSDGQYLFYVLQLWFENQPTTGSPIAQHLTGTLTFVRNRTPIFPAIQAEWAIANAADNVGFVGTKEILDRLLPVGERAKLILVQKRRQDDIAYAWSKGAGEYDGWRHPSQQIPPGDYELHIRVRGIDIDDTFTFHFSNPGAGADPTIGGELVYQ